MQSLMDGRTVVTHGGRRFVCRAPSCRTVILALSHFSLQILGARLTFRKNPAAFAGLSAQMRAGLVLREIPAESWPAVGQVLESCCELYGGAPGEIEELLAAEGGRTLASELIAGVAALCDVGRLVEACELDKRVEELESDEELPEATAGDDGPLPMEIIVTRIAERFGQAPHQVMEWPYVEVIDLCESILPAIAKAGKPRGPEIFGLTTEEWGKEGVTLH